MSITDPCLQAVLDVFESFRNICSLSHKCYKIWTFKTSGSPLINIEKSTAINKLFPRRNFLNSLRSSHAYFEYA